MSDQPAIPCLPENAPFTPEQRAYLNGFLAGLFSRAPARVGPSSPPVDSLAPLAILFGSQTGNAEALAKRAAKEAGKRGFAPTLHDLARYPAAQLAAETRLLLITSTYGDGDPPDNARAFWTFLSDAAAPKLARTRFSVCAIGDSNYPKFCGFGRDMDARLEALGAQRVHPRADCDVDFEEPFAKWLDAALAGISETKQPAGDKESAGAPVSDPAAPGKVSPAGSETGAPKAKYSRSNPFSAALAVNRRLNGSGSAKDTRHFEIDLGGSGLRYEAGDALGVVPTNCPELVREILGALGCTGDEMVPGRDGAEVDFREALFRHFEITKIPRSFLEAIAARSGDDTLKTFAGPGANGELTKFLWGREIIDLLLAHPAVKFGPAEFTGMLRKLQPRLYSISSSPKAHPGQVHLTVNIVRYESLARSRKGVCSTFLAERVEAGSAVPVFVHTNPNFRPPADGQRPMIMVGPGTGVAPFRAFLEERRAAGAPGRNWLFFGDQRKATDYMYREELEAMRDQGVLTRLDTAFSRDQAEKVYVQQRMREQAAELFAWLEEGAHFYVCGDASRMAKDVDGALHDVIQTAGGRTAEQAIEYVKKLRSEKRYQRDVY
jgi:sulfite reductase (NADPH) flavoprotein alpha-component